MVATPRGGAVVEGVPAAIAVWEVLILARQPPWRRFIMWATGVGAPQGASSAGVQEAGDALGPVPLPADGHGVAGRAGDLVGSQVYFEAVLRETSPGRRRGPRLYPGVYAISVEVVQQGPSDGDWAYRP
jgi:hypothetical protein